MPPEIFETTTSCAGSRSFQAYRLLQQSAAASRSSEGLFRSIISMYDRMTHTGKKENNVTQIHPRMLMHFPYEYSFS